jgi:hypothetical protein
LQLIFKVLLILFKLGNGVFAANNFPLKGECGIHDHTDRVHELLPHMSQKHPTLCASDLNLVGKTEQEPSHIDTLSWRREKRE